MFTGRYKREEEPGFNERHQLLLEWFFFFFFLKKKKDLTRE